VNASGRLPFTDGEFDAITCIDAINHLPDRPAVVAEWARVLKPSGRLLFTDPITITGPLSKDEIAIRSSAGFFLFVPAGYDRQVLEECGLRLLVYEDTTENMAQMAQRRHVARAAREEALRTIEGDAGYEQQQKFLEVAARIARERRLSRFAYVAGKNI
jgi:SAM-dependent methyltransferase